MEELNYKMANLELMRVATNVSSVYNENLRAASAAIDAIVKNSRQSWMESMRVTTSVSSIYNENLRATSAAIDATIKNSRQSWMESMRAATSVSSIYNENLRATSVAIDAIVKDSRQSWTESMRVATSVSSIYNENLRAASAAIDATIKNSRQSWMESMRAATSVLSVYNENLDKLRSLTVGATIYNLELNEIDSIDLSSESKTSVFNKNKLIVEEFIKRQVPKVLNVFTIEKFKEDFESKLRGFVIGLLVNSIGVTGSCANNCIEFKESERYISIQYDGETIQTLKSKELMKHLENIKKQIELNRIKDF